MERSTSCLCLVVVKCLMFVLTMQSESGTSVRSHWSQWRGADGSGVSTETGLPSEWNPETARWKTALPGRGHSSPIVWGNRVFLTAELQGPVLSGGNGRTRMTNGSELQN